MLRGNHPTAVGAINAIQTFLKRVLR